MHCNQIFTMSYSIEETHSCKAALGAIVDALRKKQGASPSVL